MPYLVKVFLERRHGADLLMLEVLFTQDSETEHLFCGASSGSEPSLFSAIISSALCLSLFKMTFQHDFGRVTDKADGSIVLAEL